jgi:hypothetical protein
MAVYRLFCRNTKNFVFRQCGGFTGLFEGIFEALTNSHELGDLLLQLIQAKIKAAGPADR